MWIITEQFCEDPRAIEWSSSDFRRDAIARLTFQFRLLSDDGDVCYAGLCDANPNAPREWANDESVFEPLFYFGMGRFGCNRIEYRRDGRWEEI
jgi:hypothetical protein